MFRGIRIANMYCKYVISIICICISSFKLEQIFSQNDNTTVQKEKYFAQNLNTVTCFVNELISATICLNTCA